MFLEKSTNQKLKFVPNIKARCVLVVVSFQVILLIAAAFYMSFFNLNTFGEGYLHYILAHGDESTPLYLNLYYNLFHYIGRIFDHTIVGYRLLCIPMIVSSSAILGVVTVKFIDKFSKPKHIVIFSGIVVIQSFFFYLHIIPTLSYVTVVSCSIYLWLAALLLYCSNISDFSTSSTQWRAYRFLHLIFLAFATWIAFTARPNSGIMLLCSTPVFIHVFGYFSGSKPKKIDIVAFCFLSVSMIAASCIVFWGLVKHFPMLYKGEYLANHWNMFSVYKQDVITMLYRHYYAFILSIAISSMLVIKWKSKIVAGMLSLAYIATALMCCKVWIAMASACLAKDFAFFVKSPIFFREYFAFCLFMAIVIFGAWINMNFRNKKFSLLADNKNDKTFAQARMLILASSIFAAFCASFGTAGYLSRVTLYGMSALSLPIVVFLFDITKKFDRYNIIVVLFSSFSSITALFCMIFFQSYSNRAFFPNHKSILSVYSRGLRMEKEQAASIDGLIQALREEGFDFEKDRIFSSYLGGIVSASGAKSLGCVFQIPVANIRDLERYDILNCMFLDLEAGKDIKNVYVLLSEKQKLSPRIVEHFLKMVRKDQEIKRIYIGEGPENIFSDRGSRLFLVGPYSFNKEFVPDKRIVEQYMKLYGI